MKGDNEAIPDFNEVIRLNPKDADAHFNLGYSYYRRGDFEQAVADLNEIVRLDPSYMEAYSNLAWILARCPETNMRNGQRAVGFAGRACELSGWKSELQVLAAAYAEAASFDEAVKWEAKHLELNLSKQDAKNARELLSLFHQHMPYHEKKTAEPSSI
jgi:serine/threonine-protein kinase